MKRHVAMSQFGSASKKKEEKKTGPLVDSCMPGGTQKPNGKRNCEKKEREGIQEIDAERVIKFFLN